MKRIGFFLLLFVFSQVLPSCGDSADSGQTTREQSVIDVARQKLEEAGRNIEDLKNVRDWIVEQAETHEGEGPRLMLVADEATDKIVSSFRTLVRGLGSGDQKKAETFRKWAQNVIREAEAKGGKAQVRLARMLDREMTYLWELALKADPGNAEIRRKLGFVEHDKDLNALLNLPFIDEDKDIKYIQDLIEAVNADVREGPDGKKWLPRDFAKMKDYQGIDSFIDKLRTAHEEKLKDPFFKEADRVFKDTVAFLKQKKNLAGYRWVGRVHRPYLFIVERDSAWNETDVARKKGEQLQELIDLFHGEYSDTFQLKEIQRPMPIIVFKRLSSYRQYAVGKTLSGALGHFEHGSERIVLSDQAERDTMFHEGTHQLMTYHTKGDTIANFLSRSYWFQEGLAEYFGGTSVYTDKETKKLRFQLGVLQGGRLEYWRQNEQHAYKLWDLIGLTFFDRQKNISEGKQNKNLMVYSQGWLLVYFLYNFRVDGNDVVQISEKPNGKYKQAFLNYMKMELDGKSGRDYFLKALGLWDSANNKVDQAKFDKFEEEFLRYYEWINRKLSSVHHVKNRRLIPWNKVENSRGEKFGEEADDRLPPLEK